MKTYIIGHLKPDTDAVVAALALEYYFKQTKPNHLGQAEAVITEGFNPETEFLFNKLGLKAPRQITAADVDTEDQIVLVDHNEENQRLTGLNPDQIIQIVDHHKPNLNLANPIWLDFKPLGSTTTIIFQMMSQAQIKPAKDLATLMLAAILSDTVGFKSATTTPADEQAGKELAQLASISDLESFTLELFKAKSNVSQLSPEQIVKNDYKVFEFAKKTFIGQIETVEQETILNRKSELLTAMAQIKAAEKVELIFCAVTDILKLNTKILILGPDEAQVAETAFGTKVADSIIDIGPKMSRKKEIAPPIEAALK